MDILLSISNLDAWKTRFGIAKAKDQLNLFDLLVLCIFILAISQDPSQQAVMMEIFSKVNVMF